jgi:hypothetical protein
LVALSVPKSEGSRLPHLEVNRPVLDLEHDVVVEPAVERAKVVVGSARAIVLRVPPVHVVVVDEPAVEEHPMVRCERAGDHVRCITVRPAVRRRAESSLRVGLQHESREVRNRRVDVVDRPLPESGHARIERIEGLEPTDACRAAEIHGDSQLYSPRAELSGQANEIRDEASCNDGGVGVDVVHRARVHAH